MLNVNALAEWCLGYSIRCLKNKRLTGLYTYRLWSLHIMRPRIRPRGSNLTSWCSVAGLRPHVTTGWVWGIMMTINRYPKHNGSTRWWRNYWSPTKGRWKTSKPLRPKIKEPQGGQTSIYLQEIWSSSVIIPRIGIKYKITTIRTYSKSSRRENIRTISGSNHSDPVVTWRKSTDGSYSTSGLQRRVWLVEGKKKIRKKKRNQPFLLKILNHLKHHPLDLDICMIFVQDQNQLLGDW